MSIYLPSKNANVNEKKPEQVMELSKQEQQQKKTYTQEEVLAMMKQIQEGSKS